MKISPVPSVVNSMTMATTNPRLETASAPAAQELTIPDGNETETTEAVQPLSPQYARIAKERRALQLERRALEEQKKAIAAQATGGSAIDVATLKSQPLKILMEHGVLDEVFYNDLANHIGGVNTAPAYNPDDVDKRVNSLIEQKLNEQKEQVIKAHLSQEQRKAQELIQEGDTYELVRANRKLPDVIKLIERAYRDDETVIPVEEALELIENELIKDMTRMTSLNKVKSLFAPPAPPAPQPQQYSGMRTLRNKDTASVPSSAKARALAAFNGTLKQ